METSRTEFSDQFDNSIPFGKALVMKRHSRPVDPDAIPGVEVGGCVTNVPHLVVEHSPTGFEFGYAGSGPADLALNVCQLYLNLMQYKGQQTQCYDGQCWSLAWSLHQDFKREFIEGISRRGATVPFEQIDAWFKANITGAKIEQCAEDNELGIE